MCTGCLQTRSLPSSKMPDTVLMMSEGQEIFSKDSYCILTRISRVLKDVYGVTANSISSFLRQAGYTVNDVGRYINHFYEYEECLIPCFRVLQNIYGETANNIASILKQAGYSVNDIGR